MSQNRVYFFDTTLRDGEQSPGCSMTHHEKLAMAHSLADLGVDIIEAGFAIASTAISRRFRQLRGKCADRRSLRWRGRARKTLSARRKRSKKRRGPGFTCSWPARIFTSSTS